MPGGHSASCDADCRSGSGVSAFHRKQSLEAGTGCRGRRPGSGRRLGAVEGPESAIDYHRHARRIEVASGGRRPLMKKHVLALAMLLAGLPASGYAQEKKFQITDNSFFVEEAFNQERGIFQNIFIWARSREGLWNGSFTQEWPAPATTNQFSYTIPFAGGGASERFGGVLLNYRCQLLEEGGRRPAFAPRFSVILPT